MVDNELVRDTLHTWQLQRPDLDFAAMATFLRVAQLMNIALPSIEAALAPHGVNSGEFDVLASLRRGGPKHELTPSALARVAMVSPAGMTNRLDRLAAAGLIARRNDPNERRGSLISLTARGTKVANAAIEAISERQTVLLNPLTKSERTALNATLDKLLRAASDPT